MRRWVRSATARLISRSSTTSTLLSRRAPGRPPPDLAPTPRSSLTTLRLLVPAGHPLAGRPAVSLAEFAGERWIHGWGDTGGVLDMLAAVSGFHPRVACRSSDYRFMSALVGAGVGVALVPSLALTGRPDVRDLQITPQPTRYVGAYLPKRHRPNPAAERLLAALRTHALVKQATQTGHR